MYVIVIGCGSLGSGLGKALANSGHDVVIVDDDPKAFSVLGATFNGVTITGNGIDEYILRKAGIERADAFAAVTSSDNTNIMAAQIAKSIFRVPRVVARIFDPGRGSAYHELGLDTVCPTSAGVAQMCNALLSGGLHRVTSLGAGEVEMVQIRVSAAAGKTVEQVEIPSKLRIAAVSRDGHVEIAGPPSELREGDLVIAAVRVDAVEAARSLIGGSAVMEE